MQSKTSGSSEKIHERLRSLEEHVDNLTGQVIEIEAMLDRLEKPHERSSRHGNPDRAKFGSD